MKTSDEGHLLDSSALIALLDENHAHHDACLRWMEGRTGSIYTCPITQGAVIRVVMRNVPGATFADALQALEILGQSPLHRFLPDDLPYALLDPRGIIGHAQVTDAYLAHLARHHGLRLATLDRAQAALYPDVSDLIA
ncbi:MAG: PIN domain-containing protein [Verrucomicrobiaceae bacterium]|nr:MAG: PIN domain-containing protein [Verrucomicrobiaceae bacterium]